MSIKTTSKVVAAIVGFGLALSVFAAVGATAAKAEAMTLSQLVDLFISLGIISSDKAAAAKAAVSSSATTMSATFSKDLTVGSSGADVSALQAKLGVSPATGYFGSITKAAVVAYQKANGISATGYVGPLTRAALNGSVTTTTTTTTSTGTTVVNTGVEGILTVDRGSISDTTAYEAGSNVAVLNIKLQAKLSDISIQRVKLDLGTNSSIYTKVYKTIRIVDDAGRVLGQADLNSNTVVKDGTDYYLTLGGLSYVVPKDSTKYLTVKADLYSSIKASSQTGCDGTGDSCTITLPIDGVRGTDGAGIDQYGPASSVNQAITISTTLTDSATLALSTDSANFKTTDVVATGGANNDQYDKLPVLAFDLRATKDDVKVTDLTITVTSGTAHATATTAYLYDGSTLIATQAIGASNAAAFTDSNQLFVVPKDTTKTYTVKVDIRSADSTATNVAASIAAAGVTAQGVTSNNTVTATGSATGENMVVRKIGPVFTLLSKSISSAGQNLQGTTVSTSTITASFSVQVQALGGDIQFGTQASTTGPMFGFRAYNSAGSEVVIGNGSSVASQVAGTGSTTGFSVPSSGVTVDNSTDFTLAQNNTVTINPTITVGGKDSAGSPRSVSLAIDQINWISNHVQDRSTFMSGKTDWRTSVQTPN